MTRGIGNMEIFRQIEHFSKVLVVWEARVGALTVYGASCKTADSLKG
jgi:hypothetical protein